MTELAVTRPRERAWTPTQWAVIAVSCLVGVGVRWIALGASLPTFDETFTGVAARLPVTELPEFLRTGDSHPPLDYLLRHWFAQPGDAFWLRFPSAMLGTATLLVAVWWMRGRGWFGVFVIAMTSVAAIQVLYARQARMYAVVILVGTIVAAVGDRWLQQPRSRWPVVAGAALTIGLLSHASVAFLALGALLLPGTAKDRASWIWRAAVLSAVAVWAILWADSARTQLEGEPASWIPYTSLRSAGDALAGQVSLHDGSAVFVVAATIVGGAILLRRMPTVGRVWLCLFVIPTVAVMFVGIWVHLLLPRSLAFAAWGPVLALAALAAACIEAPPAWLTTPAAAVAVALCFLLASSSVWDAATFEEDSSPIRRRLLAGAEPGDAVAIHPRFLAPMVRWDHDLSDRESAPGLTGEDAWSAVLPGAEPTGTLWVIVPETYAYEPPTNFDPCPSPSRWHERDLVLSCYIGPSAMAGAG
jgi:hypothetical protein